MEIIKKAYEISVWDMSPKEEKVAIIGSDQMTSLARAIEPTIIRNVNGTVTLQFKMYTQFFDTSLGRMIDNPYIPLLITERVIKLNYKEKWYDLIIKNRTESSNQKMYTYTAKSLHIHELSKNGFDLEFNTELFNNQGTIFYLGKKIVEGTDWTIDEENSTFLRAYVEDQLLICRIITSKPIMGTNLLTGTTQKINVNDYVYTFNSQWESFKNSTSKKLQIIYIPKPAKGSINDFDQYILDNGFYDDEGVITTGTLLEIETSKISKKRVSNFRGKYISKKQKTRYNEVLGKYVTSYEYTSTKNKLLNVEGYVETEPVTVDLVQNFIVNSSNFEDTSGWYPKVSKNKYANIEVNIYPQLVAKNNSVTFESDEPRNSRLKITPSAGGQTVINTAFRSNASKIKEIKKGDVFILRYRLKSSKEDKFVTVEKGKKNSFSNKIYFWFRLNGEIIAAKSTESPNTKTVKIDGKTYNQIEISFLQDSYDKDEVKDITFEFYIRDAKPVHFEDIQLFRKIVAVPQGETKERALNPGEIPRDVVITKKYYYDTATNKNKKKPEKYQYLSPNNTYIPVYYEGYPKIASIEKSQSNRFNLIQELCETFECWADFIVEHDDYGRIKSRKIQFKEYIGEVKYAGFKYGINLKSIQRTIDSEQIVTKTIVKQNSNQHGKNGFCTIARAVDNPSGETFILNFDYYVTQGLLDKASLQQDLYENFNKEGKGGFYSRLKALNSEIQTLNDNYSNNSATLTQAQANLEAAEEIIANCDEQLSEYYKEYKNFTKTDYPTLPKGQSENIANDQIIKYATQIEWCKTIKGQSVANRDTYKKIVDECESKEESYTKSINLKTAEKEVCINTFFKKYKNFIQEGTWNSEEYYSDNEYYLEGLNVSRTSSKPKITYTIDVIDISMLEGYEAYDIDVGDKTFIEDVEFFGYVFEERGDTVFKRPYREEVVITEIKEDLDSPEKNQIKVQNYKTQFDDLFQRITAVTEQLQYATGGYNRASAAFNNDGTISASILQSTILSQAITLQNAKNGSVIWDGEGVKVVDQNSPNKLIQITSGKIAISEDGGKTTKLAITAAGINTSLLTAGQINTDKIFIGNTKDFAFRWDKTGLNAYYGDDKGYDYGKFVRFDKYGVYGYSKGSDFRPKSLYEVEKNADFGLTWEGFFLKSNHGNNDKGYIEIDSKNDFQVIGSDGKTVRLKIGLIDEDEKIYGLRIFGTDGVEVVDTDSDGNISITGKIFAKEGGKIGGWEIKEKALVYGKWQQDGCTINPEGTQTEAAVGNSGSIPGWTIKVGKNFGVIKDGTLYATNVNLTGKITATSGNIGNWRIVDGNITSSQVETEYGTQGIILDAKNSQIYSAQYKTSLGADGWSINNDEAIFNNITLRGALKCAVLEYGEVQAVGGILMVRPSTTIKDYKFSDNDQTLRLEVENAFLFKVGDWVKIASNPQDKGNGPELKDSEGNTIIHSGINTNLFECKLVTSEERTNEEGKEINVGIIELNLSNIDSNSNTNLEELKKLPLKGMGIISLGVPSTRVGGVSQYNGSIGISLNSSSNDVIVPETSFSMFTLEERKKMVGDGTWKYLQPHIILGKIPNDSIYDEDLRGKYGLYADAVQLKGSIIATKGKIGGWDISAYGLSYTSEGIERTYFGLSTTSYNDPFYDGKQLIRLAIRDSAGNDNFIVTNLGKLYATGATISGKITASTGQIGSWNIGKIGNYTDSLFSTPKWNPDDKKSYSTILRKPVGQNSVVIGVRQAEGESEKEEDAPFYDSSKWNSDSGGKWIFQVTQSGSLTATKANITGTITATGGSIGGWEIGEDALNYRYNNTNKNVKAFFRAGADSSGSYQVGNVKGSDWLIWTSSSYSVASDGKTRIGTFGVNKDGELHVLDVTIGQYLKITKDSISSSYKTSDGSLTTFDLFMGNHSISKEKSDDIFKSSAGYTSINLYLRFSNIIKIGTAEYSSGSKYGVIELNGRMYVSDVVANTVKTEVLGGTSNYISNAYITNLGTSTYKITTAHIATANITTANITTLGSSDNRVTKAYVTTAYINTLGTNTTNGRIGEIHCKCFDAVYNDSDTLGKYYTINPAELADSDRVYKYFLGTKSFKWTGIAVSESSVSLAYNESESGNTSDERKKNSITKLSDKYSTLFDKLNPIIYKYNDGNSNRYHTGFIAQDVEKALAESDLTTQDFAAIMHRQGIDEEGNEMDCYYLRYGEFVALNTNEIQKLKKRVAELENQLAILTSKETAEASQNLES